MFCIPAKYPLRLLFVQFCACNFPIIIEWTLITFDTGKILQKVLIHFVSVKMRQNNVHFMWIFAHISDVPCRIFFGVNSVFKYKR